MTQYSSSSGRGGLIFLFLLACAYWPATWGQDFIPSNEWRQGCTTGTLGFGFLMGLKLWLSSREQPGQMAGNVVSMVFTISFMIIAYSMLLTGFGCLITSMNGKSTVESFAAHKSYKKEETCMKLDEAEVAVCFEPRKYKKLPPRMTLKLQARKSWFGTIAYPPQ